MRKRVTHQHLGTLAPMERVTIVKPASCPAEADPCERPVVSIAVVDRNKDVLAVEPVVRRLVSPTQHVLEASRLGKLRVEEGRHDVKGGCRSPLRAHEADLPVHQEPNVKVDALVVELTAGS